MKCVGCGAEVFFDPKTKKIKCEYCGLEADPSKYDNKSKKAKESTTKVSDKIEMKSYGCSQCGAKMLVFDDTAVTFCSYCGSSMIIEPKLYKEKRPEYIIPFTITKEECEELYKKKVSKFLLAPDNMKEDITIKKFRGIYMPYAIYNAEHHGVQENKGEKYSHRVGDYVYYNDYLIAADVDAEYNGISYDLASNFYDKFSNVIAPFDFNKVEPFNTSYLSGYYADSRDVDTDTYETQAELVATPIARTALSKVKEFRKYGCSIPQLSLIASDAKVAYYPVYFLAIRNKNEDSVSYAVVNGQTGKIAVEMPIDFKKYLFMTLIIAVPLFILLNFIFTLTPTVLVITGLVFLTIILVYSIFQNGSLSKKENYTDDVGYQNVKKKLNIDTKLIKTKKNYLKEILAIIISIAVLILNPVEDMIYYGAIMVSFALALLSIKDLVQRYNELTTRKLDQLGIRGGDESE